METDKIVLFGRNRYEFTTIERAIEAREWTARQGNIANPAEFAARFGSDCKQLPGPLGGSTFR